jgi:DNA-binding beta-propeller fold protein YncE
VSKTSAIVIAGFSAILILAISTAGTKARNGDSTKDSSQRVESTTINSAANFTFDHAMDSLFPVNSFPAPDGATRGLAFDGTYLWSADNGDDPHSQNGPMLYKLDPNTGAIIASYPHPGKYPNGLAWDGHYLWHSDHGTGLIYKLDPLTVTVVDSFQAPGGFPFDLAFHDGFLYAVEGNTTTIAKIDTSTGAVVDTIECSYPGALRPFGLTVASTVGDGLLIVADDDNDTVNEQNLITSNWINQWSSNPSVYPCGLAFDPATSTLWVSCWSKDSIYAFNVVTGIEGEQKLVSSDYNLSQNYPNPFNPTTTIKYRIPKSSRVRITVLDILGRHVATLVDEFKRIGNYEVEWNGSMQPSGVYFYQLQADQFREIRKMVLVK